jgi:predicted acylesterase/phospholipase RssA
LAGETGGTIAPLRSLVLAGGGMRVAYQAGVVAALHEAGLRFSHVDGTSGGTLNTSMVLCGIPPAEACERWRSLPPRYFSAPYRWSRYMTSAHWPALSSGQGLVDKVFPHLGISAGGVRSSEGLAGTYNVANFSTKRVEVVPHPEMSEDLLVAAVSLPMLMPAVERAAGAYTDAVWLRDSNVPEAVRRGAQEVWLVWCIGNTPRYQDGLFRQYVQMIELTANGTLFADLAALAAGPDTAMRLHVIKPRSPIPLDPDYFLGRVDGAALVDMGYQDAWRYLDKPAPLVAPWDTGVTAMDLPVPTAVAPLRLSGRWSGASPGRGGEGGGGAGTEGFRVHFRLEKPFAAGTYRVFGDVVVPGRSARAWAIEGTGGPGLEMALRVRLGAGTGRLYLRPGRDGVHARLTEGPGEEPAGSGLLELGPRQALLTLGGAHASNAVGAGSALRARREIAAIIGRATNW